VTITASAFALLHFNAITVQNFKLHKSHSTLGYVHAEACVAPNAWSLLGLKGKSELALKLDQTLRDMWVHARECAIYAILLTLDAQPSQQNPL